MSINPISRFTAAALICCIVPLSFCSLEKENPVAKVGDESLLYTSIDMKKFEHLPDSTRSVILLNYINDWVDQELLYQEAQRQKIRLTPTLEQELERVRKSMYVNLLVKDMIEGIVTVTDQDVKKYYDDNPGEFYAESNYYRFEALKTPNQAFERTIDRQMSAGLNIRDLYRENPDRCELVSIGDSFLGTNDIAPEFAAQLRRNINNENFFKITYQNEKYYIKILEVVREGETKNFAQVSTEIRNMLMLATRNEKYQELINRLRKNMEFEINMDILSDPRIG